MTIQEKLDKIADAFILCETQDRYDNLIILREDTVIDEGGSRSNLIFVDDEITEKT